MTAEVAGFVAAQRTDRGVPHSVACRALEVPESTFYKHLDLPPTEMQLRRQATDAEVKRAFGRSQGTYGSPRVRAQLRRDGISVSNKTVEASMARQSLCARPKREGGLASQNPWRDPAGARPPAPPAPDNPRPRPPPRRTRQNHPQRHPREESGLTPPNLIRAASTSVRHLGQFGQPRRNSLDYVPRSGDNGTEVHRNQTPDADAIDFARLLIAPRGPARHC